MQHVLMTIRSPAAQAGSPPVTTAGVSPAFQADHQGPLGLVPNHFVYPLAAPDPVELLIRRKDPGLIRVDVGSNPTRQM